MPPKGARRPRILFLDAYDSFANNITALLATLVDADVHVLAIDAKVTPKAFRDEVACYDAVVCGPGPGSPDCAADIGLMQHVWGAAATEDDPTAALAPALGICLGFQSLVAAHGGRVRRLQSGGLHGMVRAVDTQQQDIFRGVAPFRATLYHSLGADIGQDGIDEASWAVDKWKAVGALKPLAWVEEALPATNAATTTTAPAERILMAVRHATLPLWGLQYHPESVCTDAASHAVLTNWFWAAVQWNVEHGRIRAEPRGGRPLLARQATRPSLLSMPGPIIENDLISPPRYISRTIPLPVAHVQVPDLVDILQPATSQHIVLESASAAAAVGSPDSTEPGVGDASDTEAIRGRYSIVALDVAAATRIEYRTGDRFATIRRGHSTDADDADDADTVPLDGSQSIWQLLAAFHEARRAQLVVDASVTPRDLPFLGGFMGYVTYEQGLSDIGVDVAANDRGHTRPDICWAWITRSLVVDHDCGVVHVQSLGGGDDAAWVDETVCTLQASPVWASSSSSPSSPSTTETLCLPPVLRTQLPDAQHYQDLVRRCQEYIAAGESYELCLTGETRVTTVRDGADGDVDTDKDAAGWSLYRALRRANPAPFASYLRIGTATLVSSSPERFLSFNPSATTANELTCSMRPMKGTVRRSATVRTLADAQALLHVPKEEAENLMIVDLVRHDLHAVCGPARVHVPRLLQVEPYGHVFQMVSVVQGSCPSRGTTSGIDMLSASLPPGSMTGAPKKRSCALLQGVEAVSQRTERSLYAGVVGYVCVTGRGDWSVTIRSLFRWDDETMTSTVEDGTTTDVWHIGAGGAVTILSTPEGECEEMLTKLASPLGVFGL